MRFVLGREFIMHKMERIIQFILVILSTINTSTGRCPKAIFEFRNKTTWASYNFIDSTIGNIGSLEICPYTGRPYVYLPCYLNSSWGHEPYFSDCIKPNNIKEHFFNNNPYYNLTIEQLANLPITTTYDISNVINYLNGERTNLKSSSDITLAVNILDRIITNNLTKDDIQSDLYSIVNKLLSLKSHKMNTSIVKLLSLLETYSRSLNFDELEKSFIKTNLAVSVVNRPNTWTEPIIGFAFDPIRNRIKPINLEDGHENSTLIILDTLILMKQKRLTFSVYNNINDLFNDKQYRVLTSIISLTIDKPELIKTERSFVKIHFFMTDNFNENNPSLICAYWNIFDDMTAQWSKQGCNVSSVSQQRVTCVCDHLTHFAVVTDIQQTSIPKYVEQFLSMITLIGILLSSIGLCLTILTFILFKELRHHFSQKSLLFLSINLLCANILFSIICLRKLNELQDLLCIIIASLLHYFILSSFCWMFIMTLIQYLLFVKVFSTSTSTFTRKAAIFAQFVPMIPVIIVLALDRFSYTRRMDQVCWLSSLTFYLSFILPIVLYILINSILYSIIAYSLLFGKTGQKIRSTQPIETQRCSRVFVAFSCFIVLGLTWIFGLFTFRPMRYICEILFCTFASLTGFLIFLLYIITSKTKRTYWNNAFKSRGISSIYSPTTSSTDIFSNSKEVSTASISDHPKIPSRHMRFPIQSHHFIDAYMPSSPPPPAPPILPPPPPPLLIEDDHSLSKASVTNHFYEPRHVWAPETNYIYETNQMSTSVDDYSLFYASNHDSTKL